MSAPSWPGGPIATVGREPSVRDLIAELARIEDALRVTRAPRPPRAEPQESRQQSPQRLEPWPGWEPSVLERPGLVRRERQIVAELRRHRHQWRAAITGSTVGARH